MGGGLRGFSAGDVGTYAAAAFGDCHWLQQTAYTNGNSCSDLLRHENLDAQFADLMRARAMDVDPLPASLNTEDDCMLGVESLSEAVRSRLAEIYRPDFE